MSFFVGTQLQCEQIKATLDKAHVPAPYPDVFTVAPGKTPLRTPTVQKTWDGIGETPLGWTKEWVAIQAHPTDKAQFSLSVDGDLAKESATLSAQEKSDLSAARAVAVPKLPEDWKPAEAVAVGGVETEVLKP